MANRKSAAPKRRGTTRSAMRTGPKAKMGAGKRSSGSKRTAKSTARTTKARTRKTVPPPPAPPSSLDLDRGASAARSGRAQMASRLAKANPSDPILTGGDPDADWESAGSVGDEAPGGDNPTPDQDIVEDIGRAVGIDYEDTEELKSAEKIEKRDRKRWELDPASSEDYKERLQKK